MTGPSLLFSASLHFCLVEVKVEQVVHLWQPPALGKALQCWETIPLQLHSLHNSGKHEYKAESEWTSNAKTTVHNKPLYLTHEPVLHRLVHVGVFQCQSSHVTLVLCHSIPQQVHVHYSFIIPNVGQFPFCKQCPAVLQVAIYHPDPAMTSPKQTLPFQTGYSWCRPLPFSDHSLLAEHLPLFAAPMMLVGIRQSTWWQNCVWCSCSSCHFCGLCMFAI